VLCRRLTIALSVALLAVCTSGCAWTTVKTSVRPPSGPPAVNVPIKEAGRAIEVDGHILKCPSGFPKAGKTITVRCVAFQSKKPFLVTIGPGVLKVKPG
jgi:hypothetical protein